MKQIILLISIISSLFTTNNLENSANINEKINGGWTLIGGSENVVNYFDANNNLIHQSLLPLNVAGTILNIENNSVLVRNNKNELVNVNFSLQKESNSLTEMNIENCQNKDKSEIISLLAENTLQLRRDNNKKLTLSGKYDKNCESNLLDKNINFDHAVVRMVLKKNSFFTDLLPY